MKFEVIVYNKEDKRYIAIVKGKGLYLVKLVEGIHKNVRMMCGNCGIMRAFNSCPTGFYNYEVISMCFINRTSSKTIIPGVLMGIEKIHMSIFIGRLICHSV